MLKVPDAGMQVAFFKSLIELTKTPPPWLRMVNKRGTFFLPLDPHRPPSVSLPKLLSKCDAPCTTCCSLTHP